MIASYTEWLGGVWGAVRGEVRPSAPVNQDIILQRESWAGQPGGWQQAANTLQLNISGLASLSLMVRLPA